jgi:DNA-binding SARP family transcriptional activator
MPDTLAAEKRVSLQLLGSMDLLAEDGRSMADLLARPKLLGILAYLALAPGNGFVRRDKILALFWPNDDAEHARSSLRTALHRIRSSFATDVIRARGADEISIDPTRLQCDASTFCHLADSGNARAALEVYGGELLDGFHLDASPEYDSWVDRTRAGLRDRAASCARQLTDGALQRSDFPEALVWSRRELAIVPTEEGALANLLVSLASVGETAAAMRAFEEFSQNFHNDLGLDISPGTRSLVDKIRKGQFNPEQAFAHDSALTRPAQARVIAGESSLHSNRRSRVRIEPAALIAVMVFVILLLAIRRVQSGRAGERQPNWDAIHLSVQPLPRAASSFVYDPQSRQALMFGGRTAEAVVSDVWRLAVSRDGRTADWTRVDTESPAPVARWLHFGAYDSNDDRLIVVAGSAGYTTPCLSDVWVLDHAMRGSGKLKWRKILIDGASPSPRAEFGAAYDSKTKRILVQGGHDCIAPVFDDFWVLSDIDNPKGAKWTKLNPDRTDGGPPPLRSQVMGYDPDHNRAIVFGGMDGRFPYGAVALSDLWILTNANGSGGNPKWVRPEFDGPLAPPTSRATGSFDPATNRLIVFGGYHGKGPNSMTSDVWVLEGANGLAQHAHWSQVTPDGTAPPPRVGAGAAFDPAAERLIVVGGQSERKTPADLWILNQATGSR